MEEVDMERGEINPEDYVSQKTRMSLMLAINDRIEDLDKKSSFAVAFVRSTTEGIKAITDLRKSCHWWQKIRLGELLDEILSHQEMTVEQHSKARSLNQYILEECSIKALDSLRISL